MHVVPGIQSLSQTHPVEYIHSFCPVGEIVEAVNAEGLNEVGENREGADESENKVGDAERDEDKQDGIIVGNREVYIDGFNEGITVGAEVKHDGATVGNREVYIDGFKEGITVGTQVTTVGFCDGGIEVEITVGLGVTILSRMEQFC